MTATLNIDVGAKYTMSYGDHQQLNINFLVLLQSRKCSKRKCDNLEYVLEMNMEIRLENILKDVSKN